MMWESSPEEIDRFLERVYGKNEDTTTDVLITDIEG